MCAQDIQAVLSQVFLGVGEWKVVISSCSLCQTLCFCKSWHISESSVLPGVASQGRRGEISLCFYGKNELLRIRPLSSWIWLKNNKAEKISASVWIKPSVDSDQFHRSIKQTDIKHLFTIWKDLKNFVFVRKNSGIVQQTVSSINGCRFSGVRNCCLLYFQLQVCASPFQAENVSGVTSPPALSSLLSRADISRIAQNTLCISHSLLPCTSSRALD